MKEIKISQEDYDFLKDLQQELQTQDNDGTADPLYWMVEEEETVGVPDGCGDPIIYMVDEYFDREIIRMSGFEW